MSMGTLTQQLLLYSEKGHHHKFCKLVDACVKDNDQSIVDALQVVLDTNGSNGAIISRTAASLFRLRRQHQHDCKPFFELSDRYGMEQVNIHENLLNVLGYDRMIPSKEEQQTIIDRYMDFGDDTDLRYCTDPRYGLAAACAGWDKNIPLRFLNKCLTVNDAPLQYVATHSLKGVYKRLR